ncbi:MAG: hypothetical protein AAF945_11205 [Actinomycetota bacterium]
MQRPETSRAGRRPLLPSLIVTAGLCVAACATEESAGGPTDAASSLPPTDATTTTQAPTTVATTLPPTTVAPSTSAAPDTSAPPSTTPPPTGDPVDSSVTLFVGADAESGAWLYAGRWTGSDWEQAVDDEGETVGVELDAGAEIAISRLGADTVAGAVQSFAESCGDGRQGPVLTPSVDAPATPGFGFGAIALRADWPLQPRRVALVDGQVDSLVAAGRSIFGGRGVDDAAGSLDQAVVADLDGDGDTEAIVVFGNGNDDGIGPGYSGVALVDVDTGQVIELVSDLAIQPPPPTTDVPVDTATETTTTVPPVVTFTSYRVLDVLDLNGDGLMEVVLRNWSPTRRGVAVITVDGSTVATALVAACTG